MNTQTMISILSSIKEKDLTVEFNKIMNKIIQTNYSNTSGKDKYIWQVKEHNKLLERYKVCELVYIDDKTKYKYPYVIEFLNRINYNNNNINVRNYEDIELMHEVYISEDVKNKISSGMLTLYILYIDNILKENRSSVHSILIYLLRAYGKLGIKMIGLAEFQQFINEALIRCKTYPDVVNDNKDESNDDSSSIVIEQGKYTYFKELIESKMNELKYEADEEMNSYVDILCNYENDLHEEFSKQKLTSKALCNIINFEDDKDLIKKRSWTRNDKYYNKVIVMLKTAI